MPTEFLSFAGNVWVAVALGAAVGAERHYRQHPAGLRTNVLVALGSALFVSLTKLVLTADTDPTRIPSYIISGIGFLGGGVILKEGVNVRGMNTAATVWCTAAIGTLSGAGFPAHAALGAVTVLAVNIGLRPVSSWIDGLRVQSAPEGDAFYRLRVVCDEKEEAIVRAVVLRHTNSHGRLSVQGIATRDADAPDAVEVVADIRAAVPQDRDIQDIVSRLYIEPAVKSISWRKTDRPGD